MHPPPNIPLSHTNKEPNELNVRAMVSVYYQGVGPRNIGNTISFLGVPGGGHTFYNLFYGNIDSFTEKVHDRLQIIVDVGLQK